MAAIDRDPHISAATASPVFWQPSPPFALQGPAVYTLRGPRQVGKTTLPKLLIRHLLNERGTHPRAVLYLDCERLGLERHAELYATIRLYLDWTPARKAYLCLDEVTRIANWSAAIRSLADAGALASAVVIATGSHALDIKRGGERMPGRRGRVRRPDVLLLPLSFREYLHLRAPEAAGRLPGVESLEPGPEILRAAREASLQAPALRMHFDRYLATGGFLAAVAREALEGKIGEDLYAQHRDALIGEVVRAGHRESYFRELVRWLWPRLGGEFTWRDVAGETEIGSHVTAREYVEDVEAAFAWHVLHRMKRLDRRAPAFKSPKKLYPADPFIFHALHAWGAGVMDPWESTQRVLGDPAAAGRLVETVVANHLWRAYGESVFYYRSPNGAEADFVAFRAARRVAAAEVKWRGRIERRDWQALAERGGGLVLSRDLLTELTNDPPTLALPVHLLLAIFEGAATVKPLGYGD